MDWSKEQLFQALAPSGGSVEASTARALQTMDQLASQLDGMSDFGCALNRR